MDIEEAKKFARNKVEADALIRQVRDVIKTSKWQKQDMREGFKETFKPLIESQDSIKKSIDEQQNATIAQLKANQLALTQGLNQNRMAITEGFDKLDEVKKWDLAQLPEVIMETIKLNTLMMVPTGKQLLLQMECIPTQISMITFINICLKSLITQQIQVEKRLIQSI